MLELQVEVLNSNRKTALRGEALSISSIIISPERFSQYSLDQSERPTGNTINEYCLSSPT